MSLAVISDPARNFLQHPDHYLEELYSSAGLGRGAGIAAVTGFTGLDSKSLVSESGKMNVVVVLWKKTTETELYHLMKAGYVVREQESGFKLLFFCLVFGRCVAENLDGVQIILTEVVSGFLSPFGHISG